mmetsp:Transcript_85499/g.164612  ORF Transcript_85499/g.164612 Transcript_85499/m.164612 type:complete len:223 (-) Transcript_85499:17-685(-)
MLRCMPRQRGCRSPRLRRHSSRRRRRADGWLLRKMLLGNGRTLRPRRSCQALCGHLILMMNLLLLAPWRSRPLAWTILWHRPLPILLGGVGVKALELVFAPRWPCAVPCIMLEWTSTSSLTINSLLPHLMCGFAYMATSHFCTASSACGLGMSAHWQMQFMLTLLHSLSVSSWTSYNVMHSYAGDIWCRGGAIAAMARVGAAGLSDAPVWVLVDVAAHVIAS